jgi:hypothetical protein
MYLFDFFSSLFSPKVDQLLVVEKKFEKFSNIYPQIPISYFTTGLTTFMLVEAHQFIYAE